MPLGTGGEGVRARNVSTSLIGRLPAPVSQEDLPRCSSGDFLRRSKAQGAQAARVLSARSLRIVAASLRRRSCARYSLPVSAVNRCPLAIMRRRKGIAIRGRVADASGAVVAGATIDAVVADRRFATAMSAADGTYRVEVPQGVPLDLRVSLAGFANQTIAMPGQHRDVTRDVVLPVAGLSDTLIVTATRAPASRAAVTESVTALRTRTSRRSALVARRRHPLRAGGERRKQWPRWRGRLDVLAWRRVGLQPRAD